MKRLFTTCLVIFFTSFFTCLFGHAIPKQCFKKTYHNTIRYLECNCPCPNYKPLPSGRCSRCNHKAIIPDYQAHQNLINAQIKLLK